MAPSLTGHTVAGLAAVDVSVALPVVGTLAEQLRTRHRAHAIAPSTPILIVVVLRCRRLTRLLEIDDSCVPVLCLALQI